MRWWIHMTDEHINVGDLREARVRKEHERRKWKRYTQEILSKSNLQPSPYSKLSKVIHQYSQCCTLLCSLRLLNGFLGPLRHMAPNRVERENIVEPRSGDFASVYSVSNRTII